MLDGRHSRHEALSGEPHSAPASLCLQTPRLPCIIFEYDFYPIAVGIDHAGGVGLLHFLVRLCAVVGGCVALARATDHVVHFVQTTARKWLS